MKNGIGKTVVAAGLALIVGLVVGYKVDVTQLQVDVAVNRARIEVVDRDITEIKSMLREIREKVAP